MTPFKPWEMNREANNIQQENCNPVRLGSGSGPGLPAPPPPIAWSRPAAAAAPPAPGQPPPPLPSRRRGVGGMGGSAAAAAPWRPSYFGHPQPAAYSYYPPGGPLGYPYSSGLGGYPYGAARRQDDFENRLVQMAEESSAPAFQNVETLVRSFSSVAMMLESTYQAMVMSFRAVLGVVENVSRLRGLLSRLLPGLAALRTVLFFYRRVLRWLGLVSREEAAWKDAVSAGVAGAVGSAPSTTPAGGGAAWPAFTLFALLLGAPYLAYRLALRSVGGGGGEGCGGERRPPSAPGPAAPDGGGGDWLPVVAVYDFEAEYPTEMSLRRGQHYLAQAGSAGEGWVLASRGSKKGLVPVNRVARLQKVKVQGLQREAAKEQGGNQELTSQSGDELPQPEKEQP